MLKKIYKDTLVRLEHDNIPAADQEARIILENRLGVSWTDILTDSKASIKKSELQAIEEDCSKRAQGISLARIYGVKNFFGLDFEFGSETLEPRSDTEVLVDIALKKYHDKAPETLLDLGTGTGCILITLLHHWRSSWGLGVDIACDAVYVAKMNARKYHVGERARFIQGNWAQAIDCKFNLVVCNPPYIESDRIPGLQKEVKNHDPILALDGGLDGMDAYKIIFSQLQKVLNFDGTALFEIGYDQSSIITRLSEESGFAVKCIHPDMAGRARVAEISLAG